MKRGMDEVDEVDGVDEVDEEDVDVEGLYEVGCFCRTVELENKFTGERRVVVLNDDCPLHGLVGLDEI